MTVVLSKHIASHKGRDELRQAAFSNCSFSNNPSNSLSEIKALLCNRRKLLAAGYKEKDQLIPHLATLSRDDRAEFHEWSLLQGKPLGGVSLKLIFRSVATFEELSALVSKTPNSVFNSKELLAIFFQAHIYRMLEPIKSICKDKLNSHTLETLQPLVNGAKEQIVSFFSLAKEHISQEQLRPLAYLVKCLDSTNSILEGKLPDWFKFQRIEVFLAKISIFLERGVLFTDSYATKNSKGKCWTKDEIDEMSQVMANIPNWSLIGTPLLCAVVRKGKCEDGFDACRDKNGDIDIFDSAFHESSYGNYLESWSNAQIILIHELAHAIHFADRYTLELNENGSIRKSGNPVIDFPGFADLSEWRVIKKNPNIFRQGQYARIKRVEIPLDTIIPSPSSGRVQFSYDPFAPAYSPLWLHNPDSGFPFGPNAHKSPWEDWADSASLYFLEPHSLIRLAANKFIYFNKIFKNYSEQPLASKVINILQNPSALKEIIDT